MSKQAKAKLESKGIKQKTKEQDKSQARKEQEKEQAKNDEEETSVKPLSKSVEKNEQEQKTINESTQNEEENEVAKVEDVTKATYDKKADVWYKKFNAEFKESKTVKLLVYGVQKNEVMIRLANLEDQFDGMKAKSYKFDINAWAREFYLEANSHLFKKNTTKELLQGVRLQITEMNLAGSIPKSYFNTTFPQTKWIAEGSTPVVDLEGVSPSIEQPKEKDAKQKES